MVKSKLTNQTKLSKQHSSRDGAKIDTFLIHHQASTSDDATIELMVSGKKQVSANYTISNEGRLTLIVPEELRAWTSGASGDGGKGAAWDKRSVTVEIENKTGGPKDSDWTISDKAVETAAKLLHDLKARYKIEHVYGHRDLYNKFKASYPTFCPGPDTVARIVDAESDIKDEVKKPAPKPATKPAADAKPATKPEKKYVFKLPSESTQIRVQAALARHGFYNGPKDGNMEKLSKKGVQKAVKKYAGYTGDIDGNPQELTGKAVQKFARAKGGYTGRSSTLDEASWVGFAVALERTP